MKILFRCVEALVIPVIIVAMAFWLLEDWWDGREIGQMEKIMMKKLELLRRIETLEAELANLRLQVAMLSRPAPVSPWTAPYPNHRPWTSPDTGHPPPFWIPEITCATVGTQ